MTDENTKQMQGAEAFGIEDASQNVLINSQIQEQESVRLWHNAQT